MKKNRQQIILFICLSTLWASSIFGQVACNQQVNISLDQDGAFVILPDYILEGGPYDYDNMQVFNMDTGEGGDVLTGDCDDIGSIDVQVVDQTNGDSCWGTVIIEDKMAPTPYVITGKTFSLNGGSSITIPASAVDGGSFDNCSIESMTIEPSTFSAVGLYTIVFTIVDPSGNSDFATLNVNIVDGGINCSEMLYVSVDPLGQAILPADVFLEGNADYDLIEASLDNVNFSETVSFDCDDIGPTVTVYVQVENDGILYNCSTEVMVEDKLAPVAIVTADFTINLETETETYILSVDDVDDGSYDNCSDVTLLISQSEFTIDDWGQNQVVLTVTDVSGQSASATTIVTVLVEQQAPPLVCIPLSTAVTSSWGPLELWAVDFVTNHEDYDQILASLSPSGPFTESFIADCGINGGDPSTVYIKAFNNGQEEGECFVELTVVDNTTPVAVAKQNLVLELQNGSATLLAETVDNGSYDFCTDVELELDKTMFTTADLGTNQVWLTVTDLNGNFNQTWTYILVTDGSDCNLGDVIFPNNITITDDGGTVDNLSIDNLQALYGYTFEEVHPYTTADCEGIAYAYDDLVINFNFGVKVIRTWTTLNWFTADILTHVQLLKLYTSYNSTLACDQNIAVMVQNGPVTLFPIDVLEGGPYDYDNMILGLVDVNDNVVPDNIITEAYVGQTLTYSVSDITTGNSCWGDVLVQDSSSGDELIISVPTVFVDAGSSICLPLNVENFIDVQSGGGTILWDPSVISYTSLSNPNLPGVDGSTNATNTDDGELKFVWSNPDPANPLTLPDGEAIFELCFDVVGNIGEMSPITLSTEGSLGFEWYNDDDGTIPQVLINGKVIISDMPCALDDEDVSYPLANIYLPEFDLDPAVLSPEYIVDNYEYETSEVLITWTGESCVIVGYTYDDDLFDYGNGSFKIIRTITVIDWATYVPGSTDGTWTFTQVINTGIDQSSLICDVLPRTADVGDCDSGHTLDDDVEWPADLSITDYKITPAELVEFSGVDVLDSEPSFYNDPAKYSADYVDLLVELNNSTLVIGRVWTATHATYGFTWTYNQSITVDFSDFENLVNINTGTNRAMPGVEINEAFTTNTQGDVYVEGEPVTTISYEDEYYNGINLLDLILIQKHILEEGGLPEYGMLAADVNYDNKISSTDLVQLRKTLLEITPKEKGEWEFYSKEIEGPISVMPKGIFVGVKRGDVDDSVLLQDEDPIEPESNFEMNDIVLNKGETYTIPVYIDEALDAFGIEFRGNIDNDLIEIINFQSDYAVVANSYNASAEGHINLIFSSAEEIYELGGVSDPVFTIQVKAKENSLLSLAMDLDLRHSYVVSSDLELIVMGGEIGNMIGTGTNSEELSSLSVYPNPTSDYLNIDMKDVGVQGTVEVTIYELNGQRLSTSINENRIDVSNLTSGMYYYQVKIDTYTTTGKFIVID